MCKHKRLQVVLSTQEFINVCCCAFTNLSTLASVFEKYVYRDRLLRLHGRPKRPKKYTFTIVNVYVWTGPNIPHRLTQRGGRTDKFPASIGYHMKYNTMQYNKLNISMFSYFPIFCHPRCSAFQSNS